MPLPPYDTLATVDRLEAALARLRPRAVVSLGDAFHDRHGAALLDRPRPPARDLTNAFAWTWIAGNHDPDPPAGLGGVAVPELSLGGLTFRHEPRGEPGEVAGHLHPKARVASARLRLTRPCFATDGRVLLCRPSQPDAAAHVLDPAIAGLFPAGSRPSCSARSASSASPTPACRPTLRPAALSAWRSARPHPRPSSARPRPSATGGQVRHVSASAKPSGARRSGRG